MTLRLEELDRQAKLRSRSSRSANNGRIPVGRISPITRPSPSIPRCAKVKMSCIVITSCSVPTISVTWVTRRVPSGKRASWITRLIAEAICSRIARDRQIEARHQHHVLDAGERVARGVGVDRRQRAVVAGVHRLQHVERLAAADTRRR